MSDVKKLPIEEFRERGYLHEINRLLLHPLGLAMSVQRAEMDGREISLIESDVQEILEELRSVQRMLGESPVVEKLINTIEGAPRRPEDSMRLGDVWDCQNDPEGLYYSGELPSATAALGVCAELLERRSARLEKRGYVVQPVPGRALTINYLDPDEPEKPTVTPDLEFER